jgi:hypothetical protein
MCLINAGIEDTDLYAKAGVLGASDVIPRCGHIHQIECREQLAFQGPHDVNACNAWQTSQLGSLLFGCRHEDGVQQRLHRPDGGEAPACQFIPDQALRGINLLPSIRGCGGSQFLLRDHLCGEGRVGKYYCVSVESGFGRRKAAGEQ